MSIRARLAAAALAAAACSSPLLAQEFNYGAAVAIAGGEVLVGQPANQYTPGMVYRYRADAKGVWRLAGKLTATGAANNDGFGAGLAVEGGTLLVSSTTADSARGAVFVFAREASGAWRQTGRFTAPDVQAGDKFGRSIALAGDLAFVTSQRDKGAGAVYVFRRTGAGYVPDTTLTASDSEPRNWFGATLSATPTRLVVGAAALFAGRADSSSGAAYVYARDAAGHWTQDGRLVPPTPGRAGFGYALAQRGDTLYIGAPAFDRASGAVFVFTRNNEKKWAVDMRLLPFDQQGRSAFGASLALAGNDVLVSSPQAGEGIVYRYAAGKGGFSSVTKLPVPSLEDQSGAFFGFPMAASGTVAVAGMLGLDNGEGGAAIYTRTGEAWKFGAKVVGETTTLTALTGSKRDCTSGKVSIFDCNAVDLEAFLPVDAIGGKRGIELNDIWGYTDHDTGKEYAIVGRMDGTAFVDVSDPSHPVYVGDLPKTKGAPTSFWRDIKTYRHYAFIVSDAAREHGMQVFDLNKLRHPAKMPETFAEDAHYSRIHSAHNIVIDTATGFAYIVGSSEGGETCGGGLHMVDIHDPLHPTFAGCFSDPATGEAHTGYTHDAQCVVYHGPDAKYQGKEICIGFNETALSIADVTDKAHPVAITHQGYPNVGYAHQGWLTDDQKYLYEDDELDEIEGLVDGTRTLIWDVSDLENPILASQYVSKDKSSDHNLFVVGDTIYQSNYLSGLRVLDISDRVHPKQIGYFDTVPVGPDEPGFGGSWGNYPFFKSGVVAVTSMKEGLFIVKKRPAQVVP